MKKISAILKYIFNLIVGLLSIPMTFLGYILMTNSSKGSNVQNDDGLLFIPLGILILLVSLAVLIFNIIYPVLQKKERQNGIISAIGILFVGNCCLFVVLGYKLIEKINRLGTA